MPNRKAKDRKWKKEGRTANQHKKWLEKEKDKLLNRYEI